MGFLAKKDAAEGSDASTVQLAGNKINSDRIVGRLLDLIRAAEPNRWASVEAAGADLKVNEAVARHTRHHKDITEVFRKMYSDVAYKISPSKMDLSIFRSQPYFQEIERTMEELVQWSTPSKEKGSKSRVANDSKQDKKGGSEKKMGFGK